MSPGGGLADPLLLGIDAGTTRVRALVFTPRGALVAEGSAPTPIERPRSGWAEHDPRALWSATVQAIRAALERIDDPRRVAGVAVASCGEAAVPLDGHGEPVHAAIAWFDERSKEQAAWLERQVGRERLFTVTGQQLDPMFGLCKLLWLREHHPDAFARARRWLNVADYLAWRLCGEAATDYSLGSRTLALDLASLRWSDALLDEVGVPRSLFQPLRASGDRLGTLTAESARATGLARHCAVGVGGHDHVVGALAVGAWHSGTLLDSLGTAEMLLLARDAPALDEAAAAHGFSQGAMVVDRPRYYRVGAMTTSGACVEWFRAALAGGAAHETLIAEGREVPPGSDGVRFFPQMRVGDPPYRAARSRGAFLGLSPDASRGALYRALLEGLAYDAANVTAALAGEGGGSIEHCLAIGGDSRNPLLMEIKAAVFELPITVIEQSEAVSLGAALLGGLAAGVFDDADAAVGGLDLDRTTVAPDPALVAAYRAGRRTYADLAPALAPLAPPPPAPGSATETRRAAQG